MKESVVRGIFEKSNALMKGHFLLSSGLHSSRYLQCARVLQHPDKAGELCSALAEKFKKDNITAVVAPALGGVLVSYEVAKSLGVKSLFMERVEGKMTLRRGFELNKNDRVLVVEDVITTGRSTLEVINALKPFGSAVAGVGCIIDRSGNKINFGSKFETLAKIDIPTFQSKDCPLCKDKIPVKKCGSRSV